MSNLYILFKGQAGVGKTRAAKIVKDALEASGIFDNVELATEDNAAELDYIVDHNVSSEVITANLK